MNERNLKKRYTLLFACQIIGSLSLLWQCIPLYSTLLDNPGNLQSFDTTMLSAIVLGIMLVQSAYWYRVFNVPLPVNKIRIVLGHLIMFTSRLGLIVPSALFSIVLFRHLPEIDFFQNLITYIWRGFLLLAVLFSLYCFSTELDRLGTMLRGPERRL